MQGFNELADEFALLYAQSLSDDGDEVNNHIETEVNSVEDERSTENTEDTDAVEEEIVELDTIGDFQKMSHGKGFINLQVKALWSIAAVILSIEFVVHDNHVKLQCHYINCILFGSDSICYVFLNILGVEGVAVPAGKIHSPHWGRVGQCVVWMQHT